MKKVAIVMGSDSDLPVVKGAISALKEFGIAVEVHVMSAHRTPEAACDFAAFPSLFPKECRTSCFESRHRMLSHSE